LSRFHKLVLWFVRASLLALALQVGGVVHASADALAAAGILDEEHEQCPPDGACDDCLLGCPNCHCGAGLRTVLAEVALTLEPAHREPDLTRGPTEGSNAPLGPTLDSVYRPPRTPVPHHALS
jgi:hypothetical protein